MDTEELLAPDAGSPLGRSRGRVLDLLRAAGSLGVQEVADQTGLHPNTARFHLDALVKGGQASREPQARPTPGRPSMACRSAHSLKSASHSSWASCPTGKASAAQSERY